MPRKKLIQTANICLSCTKYVISEGLFLWIYNSAYEWSRNMQRYSIVDKSENWNMEWWLVPLVFSLLLCWIYALMYNTEVWRHQIFIFAFQHFHDHSYHVSVEHDEKPL